ncbi:cutinase family protein [Corynebacterium sputi]|uniref:cutinase family protein n=1 Tax=Corynebacterium sputi TaxID=489915 RepID=UPI000A05B680|nr:cutinase family protein [Corynebacterium sputi]
MSRVLRTSLAAAAATATLVATAAPAAAVESTPKPTTAQVDDLGSFDVGETSDRGFDYDIDADLSDLEQQAPPEPAKPIEISGECPAIYALGVEATGGSREDAPRDADAGFIGGLYSSAFNQAGGDDSQAARFKREYIPYNSGMGFPGPHGNKAYRDSVDGGVAELTDRAEQITSQCPETKIFVSGYSQGADVAGRFLAQVGAGDSVVSADQIAGGSLFGSPTRIDAAPIFVGTDSATRPDAVPGTDGDAVSEIPEVVSQVPGGGGPLPASYRIASFGDLDGRIASWCIDGDIVCAMPEDAPLARAIAKVGSELALTPEDPVSIISRMADSMALVPAEVGMDVIAEDVHGETLETLTYTPTTSISQRLEMATETGDQNGASQPRVADSSGDEGAPVTGIDVGLGDDLTDTAMDSLDSVGDQAGASAETLGATAQEQVDTSLGQVDTTDTPQAASAGGLTGMSDSLGGVDLLGSLTGSSASSPSSVGQGPFTMDDSVLGGDLKIGSALLGPMVENTDGSNPLRAIGKLGIVGINAASTIAQRTLTPQTIAQVASVGLADPGAGLAVLSAKAAGATASVLVPAGVNGAQQVVTAAQSEVADNRGLIEMATNVKYWQHGMQHTSYQSVPMSPTGESALEITRQWVVASVSDATGGGENEGEEALELDESTQSSESSSVESSTEAEQSSESSSASTESTSSISQAPSTSMEERSEEMQMYGTWDSGTEPGESDVPTGVGSRNTDEDEDS